LAGEQAGLEAGLGERERTVSRATSRWMIISKRWKTNNKNIWAYGTDY
jgi:hypothetical protein